MNTSTLVPINITDIGTKLFRVSSLTVLNRSHSHAMQHLPWYMAHCLLNKSFIWLWKLQGLLGHTTCLVIYTNSAPTWGWGKPDKYWLLPLWFWTLRGALWMLMKMTLLCLDRIYQKQCHMPGLKETSISLLTWLQYHALLHPYIDATTCLVLWE